MRVVLTAVLLCAVSRSGTASSAGVPEAWSRHNWEGRAYWYNSETGVSTWEDPHAGGKPATAVPQQAISQSEEQPGPRSEEAQSLTRSTAAATSMRRPMRVSRSSMARSRDKQKPTQSARIDSSNTGVSKISEARHEKMSMSMSTSSIQMDMRGKQRAAASWDHGGENDAQKLADTIDALNQEKDAAMDLHEKAQKEAEELKSVLADMKTEVENRVTSLKAEHETSASEAKRAEEEKRGQVEDQLKAKLVELTEAMADIKGLEKDLRALQKVAESELRGPREDAEQDEGSMLSLRGLMNALKALFIAPPEDGPARGGEEPVGAAKVLDALAKSSAGRIKGIKSRANGRFMKMKQEKDDLISSLQAKVKEAKKAASEKDGVITEKEQAIVELTQVMQEVEAKAARNIVSYDGIKENVMKMTMEQDRLLGLLDTSKSESADLTVRLTILKGLAVKIGEERDQYLSQRDHLAVYYSSLLENKENEVLKLQQDGAILREQLEHALSSIDNLQRQSYQAAPYDNAVQDYFPEPSSNGADASAGSSLGLGAGADNGAGADYYLSPAPADARQHYSSSAPSASWEHEYVVKDKPQAARPSAEGSDLDHPGF